MLVGLAKGGMPAIGMVAVPLLSLSMSPVQAAVLLLPIYVISDMVGVWLYRRAYSAMNLRIVTRAQGTRDGGAEGGTHTYHACSSVTHAALVVALSSRARPFKNSSTRASMTSRGGPVAATLLLLRGSRQLRKAVKYSAGALAKTS